MTLQRKSGVNGLASARLLVETLCGNCWQRSLWALRSGELHPRACRSCAKARVLGAEPRGRLTAFVAGTRKSLGLAVADFARLLHVTPGDVYELEAGLHGSGRFDLTLLLRHVQALRIHGEAYAVQVRRDLAARTIGAQWAQNNEERKAKGRA